jgi:PAS domain S-box-containing protein
MHWSEALNPSPRSPTLSSGLGLFGLILAAYALIGGIASFLGFALDLHRLTDWYNNGISIQPNATVCVMVSGLGLLMLTLKRHRKAAVCGGVVAVIGGATLFEWLSGVNLGIDSLLLFDRQWGRVGVIVPGRMGPPGSTSWTLIGIALLLCASPRLRRWVPMLGLLTLAISTFSLIGYAYGVDVLFTLPRLTVIAMQTATFIMAVSVGIIINHPQCEPMRTFLDEGSAGILARRMSVLIILIPILLGALRIKGEEAGLYTSPFGTAFRTVIEIALLFTLTWWSLRAVGRHERALRDSTVELRQTMNTAAVGLVRVSRDLRYISANPAYAKIAGVTAGQIVGRRVVDVMGEQAFTVIQPYVERVLRGEQVEYEAELPWLAAGKKHIHVMYTPWFDTSGQVTGWVASVSDITKRKQAEAELQLHRDNLQSLVDERTEQLQKSFRMLSAAERVNSLGVLSAGLGHDMSNLILPLRARLDLLKGESLSAAGEESLQAIAGAVSYLQRLSASLRMLAADPESSSQTVRTATDLKEWCEIATPVFKAIVPRGCELRCEILAEQLYSPRAAIDPALLLQSVFNLVQNAAEAIREIQTPNGRIEVLAGVALARDGEPRRVQIQVIDNGPGMSQQVQDRCMEPYFTTKVKGLSGGLGLPLVRRLIEERGGSLSVVSQAGQGTTFTISLPEATPAALQPAIDRFERRAKIIAAVTVSDKRSRLLLDWFLRSAGVSTIDTATEPDASVSSMWIVEHKHAQSAQSFASRPGCLAVVLDDKVSTAHNGGGPCHDRVVYVGKQPTAAAVHQALALLQAVHSRDTIDQ